MPLNIKSIPHTGYSERDNSDAIKQIIEFGSMGANVYGGDGSGKSFTVPANHLIDTGPFRVNDVDVKAGSFIGLNATNTAAVIASVGVTLVGDGFFEVNDPPPELMFAAAQASQNAGQLFGGLSATIIPFDSMPIIENFDDTSAQNRIVSKINGLVFVGVTLSGQYSEGRDYTFTVRRFDSGDNLLGSFDMRTSTSNQNDIVAVASSFILTFQVGDYLDIIGTASGATDAFVDYDLSFVVNSMSPVRGQIVIQELTYNYVVIQ